MTALLAGCEGVIVMMDDLLIFGDTPEQHRLLAGAFSPECDHVQTIAEVAISPIISSA